MATTGAASTNAVLLVAVLVALVLFRRRAVWLFLFYAACDSDVGRKPEGTRSDDPPSSEAFQCSEDATKYIYTLDKDTTLSRFDPKTYGFADIGHLQCPAKMGATPFSMSIDRNANAWVIYNSGELFRVSTKDASCTATKYAETNKGLDIFGMGFVGDQATHEEKLYVAGGAADDDRMGPSRLATIDTETFSVANVGQVAAWPELTGTGDGKLWGFFPSLGMVQSHVAELNRTTGRESKAIQLPEIAGKPEGWAFAFWGGEFFIFLKHPDDPGTIVYKLVLKVGHSMAVKNSTRKIVGAGVSTCAPVDIL
jgi:hypothetical protein